MTILLKKYAWTCALLVACGAKTEAPVGGEVDSLGSWPRVECGDQLCAEGELCVDLNPECAEVEVPCDGDTGGSDTDAGPCYEWDYVPAPSQCQPPSPDCEDHSDLAFCLSEAHCEKGIFHDLSTLEDSLLVCGPPPHEPYNCE
ncbi:hypothetical protein [Nannocystis sp. SCPEA4]|uniref:hypothetical protein n=1 Tax=Nannocystis sp. SCPEA4 TaxID=2996787 RepID=UPI00226EADC3|nr:hypothetical protein [Nannocystis sp. SCPEA4]MCY1059766.1 hypothetical protein [Nannocystis sp. SCPEA4]